MAEKAPSPHTQVTAPDFKISWRNVQWVQGSGSEFAATGTLSLLGGVRAWEFVVLRCAQGVVAIATKSIVAALLRMRGRLCFFAAFCGWIQIWSKAPNRTQPQRHELQRWFIIALPISGAIGHGVIADHLLKHGQMVSLWSSKGVSIFLLRTPVVEHRKPAVAK